MLQFNQVEVKRCTKCILPETMPFIKFNEKACVIIVKKLQKLKQSKTQRGIIRAIRTLSKKRVWNVSCLFLEVVIAVMVWI